MRIDEAATWICVVSTVFFIRKRKEGVIFFLVTRGKKKKNSVFRNFKK